MKTTTSPATSCRSHSGEWDIAVTGFVPAVGSTGLIIVAGIGSVLIFRNVFPTMQSHADFGNT